MTIGVWGDSITYGQGDKEALGWVGRLRQTLPDDEYNELYNFGICGENTEALLKRFPAEVEAIKPSKIILAIGINDSKLPSGQNLNWVPIDKFRLNLNELISQAKQYTSDITLIGLTKVSDEFQSARGSRFLNEEIQKYDIVISELASETDCGYISVWETLNPTIDLSDGIQPNSVGYQKLFATIKANFAF